MVESLFEVVYGVCFWLQLEALIDGVMIVLVFVLEVVSIFSDIMKGR